MSEDQKPLIPSLRPPRKRRPTIVNGWTPPPAPELRAVLTRFATPEEREAVIAAYFNQARGDPESYPVQMALVQRALFLALDAAPEEIGARLDATLDKLAELLGQQQAEVKAHTEAVKQHAELAGQQLEAIKAFVREELRQHREVTDRQIADLRQQAARNAAAGNKFQQQADSLHFFERRLYLAAGGTIFILGLLASSPLSDLIRSLWDALHHLPHP